MPYDPKDPLKDRITDIGPRHYEEFLPPVIKNNYGKWLYHEILEPGVLVHVAETGDKVFTVRVGGARLMSIAHHSRDLRDRRQALRRLCALHHPEQHRVHGGRQETRSNP